MIILNINDIPVGCLTSNSLSETIQFLRTCKTTEKGAGKSLGTLHSYSIPFECVYSNDIAIINYNDLKAFGRDRQKVAWSMVNDETGEGDEGFAFIESLDITGNTDDFIKFTGTLTGYGAISDYNAVQNVWYQNVNTYVENGGNYVFVN